MSAPNPSNPPFSEVLVVDDDPVIRQLLSVRLRKLGYRVRTVSDASQACWEILSKPPHFVISDWQMPTMDGEALCHWLRSRDLGQYVYFILITAHEKYFDSVDGMEAGADDYLRKPFEVEELLKRLDAGAEILEQKNRLRGTTAG